MPPSNLRSLLLEIANNYLAARNQPYEGNPLANIIRRSSKEIIQPMLNNPDLTVKGSPGMGQWTTAPWIGIFNKNVTDGAQEGIYVVYLFSADMERIYLTFNQGVTNPKKQYGKKRAFQILKNKARNIRENYILEGFNADDNISIDDSPPGSEYEESTIFYKRYDVDDMPPNEQLEKDLRDVINFYENYLNEENVLTTYTDFTSYPGGVEEGKRKLRSHYIRERNPKIIREAKRKRLEESGELKCDVCGFSFLEKYGERGKDFIEAHHKKPISEMESGEKTKIEDIALLCSNCHRMIHIKMPYLTIEELKEIVEANQ